MVDQDNDSALNKVVEILNEYGSEGFADALTLVLNAAMVVEREHFLGAKSHERSETRRGYANGFKSKTIKSRVGALDVSVPQVREGGFYPTALDKGMRSERALKLAIAEMYVQGVSTRKMARVTEELCGFSVSSSEVSRASQELDEMLRQWRERPLGRTPYVWLDARYEKVRQNGTVVSCAVLVAKGVGVDGKRRILGVSVSLSEVEVLVMIERRGGERLAGPLTTRGHLGSAEFGQYAAI